jgi:pSer/pThr/pTyr-binding forkhead associated (FHA) protein/tetratricopeptide (TPR) repeat protein
MYKLIIEDDEGKTTVVPLIRDEITIGRKEGNTIRLTERNVSRKHAKLSKTNGTIYIEDLTSYNGIKVNGDRIAGRAPVNEGDRIQIGDYQLALKMDKAAGAGPATEVRDEKTTPFIKDNGAAPTAMMDLAPTVQNPLVSGEQPARLVVVSSNFAGQEFALDKAAIVIGRTDENDIVINHRSISRHHAKIVREGGHYHIVDLQSANGVRVNGEEYGKVELRKGDHIDLGHVRLRFVAAGEDFMFDRDAQIVDVGGAKKSKTGLIVGALIAVLLIGVGIVVITKMTGKGTEGGGKLTPAEAEAQVAKLLVEADKAMKAEQWEEAITKTDEALKLDANQDLARDKRQKAEAERKNRSAYQAFVKSAEGSDFDSAVASYGEIAEDSVYRQKGTERYAQVKKAYLRDHLEKARKAKSNGKCEEARQHVEAALTVDEGNPDALEIGKSCGSTAVKVAKADSSHSSHSSHESKTQKEPKASQPEESDTPPAPSAPSAASSAAAEKLLQEAQDDYVHGQYQSAIEKARKAMKAQPSKAWRIIGASSCFLKDKTGASAAWGKLDATGRSFLKYVCARSGITVP